MAWGYRENVLVDRFLDKISYENVHEVKCAHNRVEYPKVVNGEIQHLL